MAARPDNRTERRGAFGTLLLILLALVIGGANTLDALLAAILRLLSNDIPCVRARDVSKDIILYRQ